MPKAALQFDLDDQYDKLEHKRAVSATDAYLVIHSIHEHLFRKVDSGLLSESDHKLTEEYLEVLNDIIEQYGIDLNDLP